VVVVGGVNGQGEGLTDRGRGRVVVRVDMIFFKR
jgi:hypothetical protein